MRHENPNIAIAYGDYYHVFHWLFRNVQHLGFDTESRQKACCGTGGNYNFNVMRICGNPHVLALIDISTGTEFTWQTKRVIKMIAKYLIKDISVQFKCFV
ncbi:hypothetical protein LguiB_006532 [Lonicera macranthoides]